MVDNNRRKILKYGALTTGAALVPGAASAKLSNNDSETVNGVSFNPLEFAHTVKEIGGQTYSIAVTKNKRTGEKDGIIVAGNSEAGANGVQSKEVGEKSILRIKDEILEEVRIDSSPEVNTNSAPEEQEDELWSQLRTAAEEQSDGDVTTMGWDQLLDEISQGAKDAIKKLGLYYVRNNEDCDADVNGAPHHVMGVSVEYDQKINSLNATLIGSVIAAGLGYMAGTLPGAIAGAVIGAIAGFAFSTLKDSRFMTAALMDHDACHGGWFGTPRVCAPEIEPRVSGKWMDKSNTMFHVHTNDAPAMHLEDISNVHTGYKRVEDIP